MTFNFRNPIATQAEFVLPGDKPSFDEVCAVVRRYFDDEYPRMELATALSVIAQAAGQIDENTFVFDYRDQLLTAPAFSDAVDDAVVSFSHSVCSHIAANECSADLWWEYIQQRLKAACVDMERKMFFDDVPREPMSDVVRLINLDRSEYELSRAALFEAFSNARDMNSVLNQVAAEYVHKNYSELERVYSELHPGEFCETEFAQFLSRFTETVADEVYFVISDLSDAADPGAKFVSSV